MNHLRQLIPALINPTIVFVKGVQINAYVEQPELKEASDFFENSIASGDFISFCDMKSKQASSDYESTMWGFMRIIFGEFLFFKLSLNCYLLVLM